MRVALCIVGLRASARSCWTGEHGYRSTSFEPCRRTMAYRARPVGLALMLALLAAAPVSLLIFFAELGVRPDVMTAMHNPFFDLEIRGHAGARRLGDCRQPASVAAGSLAARLRLVVADSRRHPRCRHQRREDDAAARRR